MSDGGDLDKEGNFTLMDVKKNSIRLPDLVDRQRAVDQESDIPSSSQ